MEKMMQSTICAVLLAISAFLYAGLASAEDPVVAEDYRLAAGDRVKVSIYGHEDLSGEFEVDAQGQLSLPLIMNVPAGGLTSEELEADITAKLQPDFLKNPRVSVEILNYRPFYIVGEVNKPGSYGYVYGMKVINAVALAGGFTFRAQKGDIKITREQSGSKSEIEGSIETVVKPGDVIEVGERFF
jgi:protein involved in polysaccharide export with SLBB domain